MLFNTLDFIIFFIVIVTSLVIIKNGKLQYLLLLAASYFFFYFSSNYLMILLIFTTIWDFYFGKLIYNTDDLKRKKIILIVSLAGNLGLLGFYKYADFAITQFNILGNYFNLQSEIPLLDLALPIAISFYTFHSITYTVGLYRKHFEPSKSFTEYALFVAFFPLLVAGPILRAKDFLPQLREKIGNFQSQSGLKRITIEYSNLRFGITLMALGFFKKMFFADNIAPMVNDIFNNPVGLDSFTIVLGAIGFGIQIYCDFSGYTDIAIGAAIILGFKIPKNFNKPYFARSPSDFWNRWHISLSSWLRDYLYIPLGGNKKGPNRTYLNLFLVMFLGGLWHGASWNFVIWGMLHGLYLAIHKLILHKFPFLENNKFFKSKIGIFLSIIITQYFVFLAWIPFRVQDTQNMVYSMQKYIFWDFETTGIQNFAVNHEFPIGMIILFAILHIISYKKGNLVEKLTDSKYRYWFVFLTSITLLILLFYDGNPETFIYFQF